jgi:hypothetical protein
MRTDAAGRTRVPRGRVVAPGGWGSGPRGQGVRLRTTAWQEPEKVVAEQAASARREGPAIGGCGAAWGGAANRCDLVVDPRRARLSHPSPRSRGGHRLVVVGVVAVEPQPRRVAGRLREVAEPRLSAGLLEGRAPVRAAPACPKRTRANARNVRPPCPPRRPHSLPFPPTPQSVRRAESVRHWLRRAESEKVGRGRRSFAAVPPALMKLAAETPTRAPRIDGAHTRSREVPHARRSGRRHPSRAAPADGEISWPSPAYRASRARGMTSATAIAVGRARTNSVVAETYMAARRVRICFSWGVLDWTGSASPRTVLPTSHPRGGIGPHPAEFVAAPPALGQTLSGGGLWRTGRPTRRCVGGRWPVAG